MKAHPLAERFPPMSDKHFDALVADIKKHGVREPIVIYDDMILDGRHRWRACEQLGVSAPTVRFQGSENEAEQFVESLNVHRRHLTIEQRRALIMTELKRDPAQSDRSIAAKAGTSHTYVANTRDAMEADGEVATVATVIGSDGVAQPAKKRSGGRPGSKTFEVRVEEIRGLTAAGHVPAQIARELCITEQQVRNIMKRAGIRSTTPRRGPMHDSTDVIHHTIEILDGCRQGVSLALNRRINMDAAEASDLLKRLRGSLRQLRALESKLKEVVNG